ncbi:FxLYD domain-containing protein [Natronoarchaeum rubrum]|uniref:FxLYD domain-containing protein n=1 Tax=Natronoarchaeum rubrum TaxID=755311 RepID=UPI00211344FE|nr:FxLYD domain-containing protein [Natronoarchaeum rubrum]HMB49688.1 FxLYD domain-containing protein [Natronoarchaeum rubrum]
MEREGDATGEGATRRRVLGLVGAGAAVGIAGCLGGGGDGAYGPQTDVAVSGNGSLENATSASTQRAFASTTPDPDATSIEALTLVEHEPVVAGGYKGLTVRGRVHNDAQQLVEYAEVRTRFYDASGTHLGTYLASTSDLAADTEWAFEVVVLESPGDVDAYDAGVFGWPP